MSSRLPQKPGEWIDRSTPIDFEFEAERYQGFAGDTVTSALSAAGVRGDPDPRAGGSRGELHVAAAV